MRNLFFSLIALCSLTTFGQEASYSFDKKLTYKINVPDEYSSIFTTKEPIYFINYLSKNALLGTAEGFESYTGGGNFNRESFFINNNRFFDVYSNSLENTLSIKAPYYYEGIPEESLKPYTDNLFGQFESIKNLNSSTTINGFACNEYEMTSKNTVETTKSTLCIDEKSKLDNVSFLFPKSKLKGLLIRLDAGDFNGITLEKTAEANAKVTFDEKKEIESFTKKLADKKKEYEANNNFAVDSVYADSAIAADYYTPDNRYDDPINSYYSYQTSENNNVNTLFNNIALLNYSLVYNDSDYDGKPDYDRNTAIKVAESSTKQLVKQFKKSKLATKEEIDELNKIFKKYFDDAKKFKLEANPNYGNDTTIEDAAAAVAANSLADYYDAYESTYKTTDTNIIDLAIDNPDVSDFLKVAPEHCKNLNNNIPTFSDKNLKKDLHNYVGQVCDLYIYNSGSVGLVETINSMRKSALDIINKYDKISKDDKEKLTTFLNSLD